MPAYLVETAPLDYAELDRAAAGAPPLTFMLDPDDPRFLSPADMPAAIASWFREHGQPAPEGIGLITRAIYDSIALNHRHILDALATPDEKRSRRLTSSAAASWRRFLLRRPPTQRARL